MINELKKKLKDIFLYGGKCEVDLFGKYYCKYKDGSVQYDEVEGIYGLRKQT